MFIALEKQAFPEDKLSKTNGAAVWQSGITSLLVCSANALACETCK